MMAAFIEPGLRAADSSEPAGGTCVPSYARWDKRSRIPGVCAEIDTRGEHSPS